MAARKKATRKTSRSGRPRTGTSRAVSRAATEAAWSGARPKRAGAKSGAGKASMAKGAPRVVRAKVLSQATKGAAKTTKRVAKVARSKSARKVARIGKTKAARGPTRAGAAGVRKASRKREASPRDPALLAEVAALAELMDSHGLLEVSYELDSDGSKRLHVARQGAGAAPAAPHEAPLAAPSEAAPQEPPEEANHVFTSPMVGTFYRAPSPEAPPFVSVGDQVENSTVVCIIEAMKVMNEISPDISGEIVSIEVENGAAVEFGQPLMLIRPR